MTIPEDTIPVSGYRRRQARAKPDAMPPESEESLLSRVTQTARLYGFLVYHPWRSDHSEKGWPDLVLLKGNCALFRELKSDKGIVTPEQQACGDALLRAGCDWDVWRPRDWDRIEQSLSGEVQTGMERALKSSLMRKEIHE